MQLSPFTAAVTAFVVILVVVAVVRFIVPRRQYYGRMFSEDNFREFHSGLSKALVVAKQKNANAHPSVMDGTAFETDAGLAVCVTFEPDEDETYRLHVSLSQPGWPTTHAVCSRFAFFVAAMLGENKSELMPYFTESRVHHLVIWFRSHDLHVRSFEEAHTVYQNEYTPIPFEFQSIEGLPPSTAHG